jgi:hypothetical protein
MSRELTLAENYSPTNPVPLRSYGLLLGTYGTILTTLMWRASRRHTRLPSLGNTALFGIATYKIARILTKAKVTSPIRAPFARTQGKSGPAEVADLPRGEGLQRALGDLLSCPFCIAPWIAATLMGINVVQPKAAQLLVRIFGMVTVSDFLQRAHAALKD